MEKWCKIIEVEKDYRKEVASMGKKINEQFLAKYMELDKNCSNKFGVTTGGVTEYINRLNNARFAPGREDILPRLVKYRNLRNKFAHEVGALRRVDEITKTDVAWIRTFNRNLIRKRDPISAYLRKARRYVRRRKLRRLALVALAFVLIGTAFAIWFAINH